MLVFSLVYTGRKLESQMFSAHLWNISKKLWRLLSILQKQPSKDVHMKRYSENLQENTHAKVRFRHWSSPVDFLHIFRTPFPKNIFGGLHLIPTVDIRITLSCFATILKSHFGIGVLFSCKFAAYFQSTFS